MSTTEKIIGAVEKVLSANKTLSLSTQSIRVWSENAFYIGKDLSIYCFVNDAQTVKNIKTSPRVSFSIGHLNLNVMLQGNSIAHILGTVEDLVEEVPFEVLENRDYTGILLKLVPYRFTVLNAEYGVDSKTTIEKRKLEWVEVETEPQKTNTNGLKAKVKFWMGASRAVSLPMSAYPVIIGTVLAAILGHFNFWLFLAAFLGGVFAHAGINLISDYYDFKKGVDTTDALSSHTGILVDEVIDSDKIMIGAFISFLITTLSGGILITAVGWPILIFGILGLVGGYSYTGGPLSYKYKGLGELFITLLMGPLMVLGAYFVQIHRVDWLPFILSMTIGVLVGSVTLSNNLRDILYDQKAKVFTLPMHIGIRSAKNLYYLITFLPYFMVGAVIVLNYKLYPMAVVLLSIPAALKAFNAMRSTEDNAKDISSKAYKLKYPLNSIKQHFQFSLLLTLGCLAIIFIK